MDELEKLWQSMFDLIPVMRQTVRAALVKDVETFEHGTQMQIRERNSLRSSFEFLRKKWIVDLIYEIHLLKTPYYSDLHKHLPEINTRSLSKRLSELEDLGMINREIKTGKPIRVYYELTDFGLGIYELLIPLLSFFSYNIKKSRKIIPP